MSRIFTNMLRWDGIYLSFNLHLWSNIFVLCHNFSSRNSGDQNKTYLHGHLKISKILHMFCLPSLEPPTEPSLVASFSTAILSLGFLLRLSSVVEGSFHWLCTEPLQMLLFPQPCKGSDIVLSALCLCCVISLSFFMAGSVFLSSVF